MVKSSLEARNMTGSIWVVLELEPDVLPTACSTLLPPLLPAGEPRELAQSCLSLKGAKTEWHQDPDKRLLGGSWA